MDRSNFCGCKGVRSCLLCEDKYDLKENQHSITQLVKSVESFTYCFYCDKVYPGWNEYEYLNHPIHASVGSHRVSGVYVLPDFISDDEERKLIYDLDTLPWDVSQSGRRKQNFGPACNFRKRKIKQGAFCGFPGPTQLVQDRFADVPLLENFKTIEQCTLEYDPSRGASIDPHIDDCWIWGERIVTVNLLADSVLTLTKYKGTKDRYNLDLTPDSYNEVEDIAIRIPMPRKSLIVLYGEARYKWEHCVLRDDIQSRRVCLAYREFTRPYLPGGEHEKEGELISKIALRFHFSPTYDFQAGK